MLTPDRVEEWAVLGGHASRSGSGSNTRDSIDGDEDADEAASESEKQNQKMKPKQKELVVGKDKFPDEFVLGLNQTWKF